MGGKGLTGQPAMNSLFIYHTLHVSIVVWSSKMPQARYYAAENKSDSFVLLDERTYQYHKSEGSNNYRLCQRRYSLGNRTCVREWELFVFMHRKFNFKNICFIVFFKQRSGMAINRDFP